MSKNAHRFSKRRIRKQMAHVVSTLDSRADRIKGQLVITPKSALKGYIKWTAAIRRAVRPLAEQFGLKVVVDNGQIMYC